MSQHETDRPPRILIVNHELQTAGCLAASMETLGYEVVGIISCGAEAVSKVEQSRPDMVLMDIGLASDIGGIEAANLIRTRCDIPVVFLTEYAEASVLERATKSEPHGFLGIHATLPEMRSTIERALSKHQADKRNKENEMLFRVLFEQADVGVAQIVTDTGRFVRINQRYCNIVGYTREELGEMTFHEITHPDDLQPYLDSIKRLLEGKTSGFSMNKRHYAKDGSTVWINLTVSPMWEAGEEPCFHVVVVEDITEHKLAVDTIIQAHVELEKRVEERTNQLRHSQEQLISQYKAIPVPTYTWQGAGDDLVLVNYNDAAEVISRGRITGLLGTKASELYHDIPDILEELKRTLAQKTGIIREMSYRLKTTGEDKYLAVKYTFVLPDLVMVHTNDITEQIQARDKLRQAYDELEQKVTERTKELTSTNEQLRKEISAREKAESALRESEKRYRQMFERNPAVKLLIDPKTAKILDANPAASQFYGYSIDELKRLKATDLNTLSSEQVLEEMAKAESEERRHFLFRHRLATGEIRDVEIHSGPVDLGDRKLLYSIVTDVTDRKRAEKLLVAERDLSVAVGSLSNLDEALQYCIETVLRISGMDGVGIYLLHDDDTLTVAAHKGLSDQFVRNIACFMADSLESGRTKESKPLYFRSNDPETAPMLKAVYRSEGLKATAAIPILHQNRVIASLHVASRTFDEVSVQTRHALETIAALVGSAIARIRTEEALRESEAQFRAIYENAPVMINSFSSEGEPILWNREVEKRLGWTMQEIQEVQEGDAMALCYPDPKEFRKVKDAIECSDGRFQEYFPVAKDGSRRTQLWASFSLPDGKVIGVGHDITRRKKVEEQLRESLEEKQVLLREIHHRVKNNLAVISSLLRFQSRYAGDEFHRTMFDDCQSRIRSMALGHELVYQSENLANVKVSDYIEKLVDHLVATTVTLGTSISVIKEIEQISFGLDTITPLGFLLTELVFNCIKHAFPSGGKGEIKISLRSVGGSEFELIVRDNGVGMSNIETSKPQTLGQVLLDAFVQQLDGRLEIRQEGGTEVRIRFKEREKAE